jgi:hypothetical protein
MSWARKRVPFAAVSLLFLSTVAPFPGPLPSRAATAAVPDRLRIDVGYITFDGDHGTAAAVCDRGDMRETSLDIVVSGDRRHYWLPCDYGRDSVAVSLALADDRTSTTEPHPSALAANRFPIALNVNMSTGLEWKDGSVPDMRGDLVVRHRFLGKLVMRPSFLVWTHDHAP